MRIVLDQGGFRSPELFHYIEDPECEFYIPDVALGSVPINGVHLIYGI